MNMESLKEKLEKQLILLDNVYNIWDRSELFLSFLFDKMLMFVKKNNKLIVKV